MTEKQLNETTTHIINGLTTDGGHHKQWDLEQALIALRGQEWIDQYQENNAEKDDDGNIYACWESGIPA